MDELTLDDISRILESLAYAKMNIQNCTQYPSYDFKMQQIGEVDSTIKKVRAIRKQMKGANGTTKH